MIHYFWWIPAAMIAYIAVAYISIKSQEIGGIWFWLLWIPIPLWALVTKVSHSLLFDGILYDFFMTLGFAVGMIMFGAATGFTIIQYIGLGLAIIGLVLMRI
jgi:hypothetical protein